MMHKKVNGGTYGYIVLNGVKPGEGGGGDTPGPDTVGTEQVKDRSLLLEDMNPKNFAKESDIDEIFND